MILGISGKIAGGKTTLAKQIQKNKEIILSKTTLPFLEAETVEVDHLGHILLKDPQVQNKITALFLESDTEKISDYRLWLRKNIYLNPEKLSYLEKILHPRMKSLLQAKIDIAKSKKKNLIIVCALPKTFSLENFCDSIQTLEVDKNESWSRVKKRNPEFPREYFEFIWKRQTKEY